MDSRNAAARAAGACGSRFLERPTRDAEPRSRRPGEPGLVEPHHPFAARPLRGSGDAATRALLSDSDEVSSLVADMEPDQKGIPALVRFMSHHARRPPGKA